MQRAESLPATVPKIGLIKRDLTKLGCAWEASVVWRTQAVALWRFGAPVPDGYLPDQRVRRERAPHCPQCGAVVMQEKRGVSAPASQSWLEGGKRTCAVCNTPLWRESRDKGSQPKPGEKYPPKNPRYRLDEYIKRMFPDRVYLLIFYEIVFNLSTMMQAAARSYRLNQTHAHCKVVYLYAEGAMEQTAVQLMSRKQRAAKLLTGDIGLTGLDALTEGEGGCEQALLEAIGRDETLLDPSQLFKATGAVSEIDIEDAGY